MSADSQNAIYWLIVATSISGITSSCLFMLQRCCGHFADSMTNAASTVPRGSGKRLAVACSACPPRGATDATTKHRVPRPPDTHDHNPLTNCANKETNSHDRLRARMLTKWQEKILRHRNPTRVVEILENRSLASSPQTYT